MPGMDGFQAVQAIKNNPRTAMIPILMYTSQEGELYLGQARALGAVGVLPKQIKPTDVSKVLYQLHLVPDRRTGEQSTFRAVSVPDSDDAETIVAPKPLTDTALREHFAELRRVLVASLDSQTDRVTSDVRMILQDAQAQVEAAQQARARPRPSAGPWILAAAALALAAASAVAWWQEALQRQALSAEVSALRAHPASGPAARTEAVAPSVATAAPGATPAASPATAAPLTASASAGTPAAPKAATLDLSQPLVEIVPYGAEPLAEPRLDVLRQLFEQLTAESFRGTVEIKSYSGRFCLNGNAAEGFSLPPDESPFAKCDVLAAANDDAATQPQRVPLAFANLLGEFRNRSHGAVDVQLLAGDATALAAPYPQVSEALTAGEWNRAASANNRIEIRVR